MRYITPLQISFYLLLLTLAISSGCNEGSSEDMPSVLETKEQPDTASPSLASTVEEDRHQITKTNTLPSRPDPRSGVLLEKADFWIGLPNKTTSLVYLRLAEKTEIKVLGTVEGYFEVMHRGLIGYVEKTIVDVQQPPKEKPIPVPEPPGKIAEEEQSGDRVAARLVENGNGATPTGIAPCTGEIGEEILPGISCVQYRAKVLEKVSTLEIYLKRIIDKTEVNRTKSIDLACRLFINEQARVYTSSLSDQGRSRPIRKYLNSLMALSYDRVEIEWTNIQYISDLRKAPDGRFYGYVHIEQQFEGFMDGQLVYGDVTEKKITIVLESYEVINAEGETGTRWDIFLSDIGVEQTKTIG